MTIIDQINFQEVASNVALARLVLHPFGGLGLILSYLTFTEPNNFSCQEGSLGCELNRLVFWYSVILYCSGLLGLPSDGFIYWATRINQDQELLQESWYEGVTFGLLGSNLLILTVGNIVLSIFMYQYIKEQLPLLKPLDANSPPASSIG